MRRAVFLDRDGVINRAFVRNGRPHPPSNVRELEILPGVPAAVARLRQAGFLTFVVTNQPDIARGITTRYDVDRLNEAVAAAIEVDEVVVCPHDDVDDCECRKPKPGMILDVAGRLAIDLSRSFMVGDRWRDIEAGHQAGCRTTFIDRGYDEPKPAHPDLCAEDLPTVVEWILGSSFESACSADGEDLIAER